MKGFDPLKNVDLLEGLPNSRKSSDSLRLGWKIGASIANAMANRRAQRRAEEAERQERERLQKELEEPPPIHGSARWIKAGELAGAGLLQPASAFDSPSSLLLGVFPDPELDGVIAGQIHWDGEGHLITVAPTRSGKSTTTIVPNLLRYRGSCVVLDPKGELYRDTAAWRRTVGQVYRIAPFEEETDGFNPLDMVDNISDARALASILMPPDPKAQNFFRQDAIAFLAAVILCVARNAPPEFRTLHEIRNITAGAVDRLRTFAEDMVATGEPVYANPAEVFLGKRKESLATLRDTFNTELAIWDDPGVVRAAAGKLDFRALKDSPVTVYISVPFHKMEAYASFLKVTLNTALDAMIRNPNVPDIPVLFVLDEFLALGPFPQFKNAMRTHAGAGVRLWFFLQDLTTLEEHYRESWQTFMGAAVKMFFGTNDASTGRLISENFLGTTTVSYMTGGASVGRSTGTGADVFEKGSVNRSVNVGVAYAGRPLLTPTEVVSHLSGELPDRTRNSILSISSVAYPISGRLVPYYKIPVFQQRITSPE